MTREFYIEIFNKEMIDVQHKIEETKNDLLSQMEKVEKPLSKFNKAYFNPYWHIMSESIGYLIKLNYYLGILQQGKIGVDGIVIDPEAEIKGVYEESLVGLSRMKKHLEENDLGTVYQLINSFGMSKMWLDFMEKIKS